MAHDDPKHPRKNPHPVQRYEVIATADAPGPWGSVKGYVSFKVTNLSCVPKDSFTGARNIPNADSEFEMTKVGPSTWKGYFYSDALEDENYFDLGMCHWAVHGLGADFVTRGVVFPSTDVLDAFLTNGPQSTYFKRSDYGNPTVARYGPQSYSIADPNVSQHPEEYFRITVSVKEATP